MLTIDLVIGDRLSMPDPDTGFMCEWIIVNYRRVFVGKGKSIVPCTHFILDRAVRSKRRDVTIPDDYEWVDALAS